MKKEAIIDFFRTLSIAFIVALLFRTFVYAPYNIPSPSMVPTLLVRDYLFVSRFFYGYAHYTLPFAPKLFKGRIFFNKPKRGDVIVFRYHHDNLDYIKRLIGLPGDRVQMIDGVLHINGASVKLKRIENFTARDKHGKKRNVPQYLETLPNGVTHKIIKHKPFGMGMYDNTPLYIVPDGHYFMMGDNRDRSDDSRNLSKVGWVPADNLLGRAEIIFFSTEAAWWEFWKWLYSIRFTRLLNLIR